MDREQFGPTSNPNAPVGGYSVQFNGRIDEERYRNSDIDMLQVTLKAGEKLTLDIDGDGSVETAIKLFNSVGTRLASNDDK